MGAGQEHSFPFSCFSGYEAMWISDQKISLRLRQLRRDLIRRRNGIKAVVAHSVNVKNAEDIEI